MKFVEIALVFSVSLPVLIGLWRYAVLAKEKRALHGIFSAPERSGKGVGILMPNLTNYRGDPVVVQHPMGDSFAP